MRVELYCHLEHKLISKLSAIKGKRDNRKVLGYGPKDSHRSRCDAVESR